MGDEEHGQPQRFLQGLDQAVEGGRADRVQPGGGFVQEQQRRVQRQRPGQAGALAHAAGQLRGQLVDGLARQPGQLDLEQGQFVAEGFGQVRVVFLQRHLHVLAHGQRGEQRAILEQHAGVALDLLARGAVVTARVQAEDLDLPGLGNLQPQDGAHQHRLAAARAADHAEDLAAAHVQVQAVVHGLFAEAVDQAADLDDGIVAVVGTRDWGLGTGHREAFHACSTARSPSTSPQSPVPSPGPVLTSPPA